MCQTFRSYPALTIRKVSIPAAMARRGNATAKYRAVGIIPNSKPAPTLKALRSKFMIAGHPAEVGEECVLEKDLAEHLAYRGHAEIIGAAPDTIIPISQLSDPARRESWVPRC